MVGGVDGMAGIKLVIRRGRGRTGTVLLVLQ